jgi:hypothetical protein
MKISKDEMDRKIIDFLRFKSEVVTNACVGSYMMDLNMNLDSISTKTSFSADPYKIGSIDGVSVTIDPVMKWSEKIIYSKNRLDKISQGIVVFGDEGMLDLRQYEYEFL